MLSEFVKSNLSDTDDGDIILTLIVSICPLWLLGFIAFLIIAALLFGSTEEANTEIDFCGIYPLPCDTANISSDYGVRVHPITGETKKHTGIDFTPKWHSNIYSIADGTVYDVSVNSAFGNCVTIEHSAENGTFYSFYAHLSKVKVNKGDEVTQGQIIALEGGDPKKDKNAGLSTGHHLHFEIRLEPKYGSDVNPKIYLRGDLNNEFEESDKHFGRTDQQNFKE